MLLADGMNTFATSGSGEGVLTGYGECLKAVGGVADAAPCVKPMAMSDGDADGDGVPDSKDKCPNTPAGAVVDAMGCPKDSDGDGVPDYKDNCPGTPKGAKVDPMRLRDCRQHDDQRHCRSFRFRQCHAEAGHESRA